MASDIELPPEVEAIRKTWMTGETWTKDSLLAAFEAGRLQVLEQINSLNLTIYTVDEEKFDVADSGKECLSIVDAERVLSFIDHNT